MTIIMGIDPGSNITGYGIIHLHQHIPCVIDYGVIRVKGNTLCEKLGLIQTQVKQLADTHTPNVLAIESVFIAKNAQSALKLGQARGAAISAVASHQPTFAEYSPREIKLAIVGYGNASKTQMQHMIKTILKLPKTPPSDAADALAIALCHCHQQRLAHTLKHSHTTAGDGA